MTQVKQPSYAGKPITVYLTPELESHVTEMATRLRVGPKQLLAMSLAIGVRLMDQTVAARELEALPGLLADVLVNERQPG